VLPARSRQEPTTEAETASGPSYACGAEHASTPEVASLAEKETVRGLLYQPLAFGARLGVATTSGAVASYLRLKEPAPLVLPARSRHEPEMDAVAESGPP
jgi:hypothetical protein